MGSTDSNISLHSNLITFTNPEITLDNPDHGRAFELDWKSAFLTSTYQRM
jgi:hypothetical protein